MSHRRVIEIEPGQTTRIELGGTGHSIEGKLLPPANPPVVVDWDFSRITIKNAIGSHASRTADSDSNVDVMVIGDVRREVSGNTAHLARNLPSRLRNEVSFTRLFQRLVWPHKRVGNQLRFVCPVCQEAQTSVNERTGYAYR